MNFEMLNLLVFFWFFSSFFSSALIDRLSKMGLGDTVAKWLNGDSNNSFFEFKLAQDEVTAG